jgi:hypothetical protein
MSRSEKMSNMIAAAFASASQPGTGNDFKDAARAFAQGNVAYQGIKDQDRATRANYANSVLGQLAAQEEAERKGIDTEADVYKKGGEGYRAYSYGGFLGDRGQHMLTQLGPAAIMNAESARTVANTAAEKAKNEVTTASEGSGVYQRDANGVVVRRDLVPKTFAPPAAEAKIDANVRAMYIYEQLNGGPLTAEQSTAAWRAMNDMDPKVVGGGGALAQSIRIGNIQDPVERKRQTDLLLQAGNLAQKVSPPAPYVQHLQVDPVLQPNSVKKWVDEVVLPQFTDQNGTIDFEGAKKAIAVKNPDGSFKIDRGGVPIRIEDAVRSIKNVESDAAAVRSNKLPRTFGQQQTTKWAAAEAEARKKNPAGASALDLLRKTKKQ